MRVIITIQHPAHVHLFRNVIMELREDGHNVNTYVRGQGTTIELLNAYDIDYTVIAGDNDSLIKLAVTQAKYELRLACEAWRIKPDLMIAMGEPAVAHVAKLVGARSLIFTDTEHATLQNALAFPFAERIYTPTCYQHDIGPKQIQYSGYHELAYLHPNRFDPDPRVLEEAGLEDDCFVILRLVGWDAAHDVNHAGFDDVVDVVSQLESTGVKVLITSEKDLPEEIKHCQISVEPHLIHHLMYYSDLFIGEGATMAAESAVLGTPAIFVSTLSLGYIDEMQEKYGLISIFSGEYRQKKAIKTATGILENYDQVSWDERRQDLLADKIDVTEFIMNQIRQLIS